MRMMCLAFLCYYSNRHYYYILRFIGRGSLAQVSRVTGSVLENETAGCMGDGLKDAGRDDSGK
jgi:hypothetical protein